jgi:hypothetical protein
MTTEVTITHSGGPHPLEVHIVNDKGESVGAKYPLVKKGDAVSLYVYGEHNVLVKEMLP